jgi:hypothetical protein
MQFDQLNRRESITLLSGAAAAWPFGAGAQQPAIPVVGYLYVGAAEASASHVAAFRKGLGETGYVESRNVAMTATRRRTKSATNSGSRSNSLCAKRLIENCPKHIDRVARWPGA